MNFYKAYINKQPNKSRYINIQSTDNANQTNFNILGCDMYHTTGSAQDPHETKDHVSNVLWIDYNDDDKDFYEDTIVENPTRMVYGFATKYKLGTKFYVRFHLNGAMNGQANKFAPDYLWEQFDNQTTIPFGSRIGFDFHFSAFGHGNSIALYSGVLDWYNNSINPQTTPSNECYIIESKYNTEENGIVVVLQLEEQHH